MVPQYQFAVTSEHAGERLDVFLAGRLPVLSRTRIQELISQGCVRVHGAAAKRSHRVTKGERIEVEVLPRPSLDARPEALPLEILYQDDDLVVVNKPAGMTVHAGAGAVSGTLVNALLHHLGKLSAAGGPLRPGIVHRLDKGTSGVLVVARNDFAHRALAEQFHSRRVEKTYIALVHGRLAQNADTIALPIARDPRRRTRMTARHHQGREARTDWHVLTHLDALTLVEVRLLTGRTHQIRVHFSAIHHPVVGDATYGAPRGARIAKQVLPPLGRNFLHAARIAFLHPRSGRRIEVRAPLPSELRVYLARLTAALGSDPLTIDVALSGYL